MHAPVMDQRRDFNRIHLRLALAAASAVVGMSLVTGCDDSRASDKKVYQTIRESRAAATGEEGAVEAIRKLEEAVKIDTASPAGKAHAASMLAQAEQAEAQRLIRTLEDGQRNALRLISEITGIGAQIDLINAQVASYQKSEPTEARALAQTQTAEVQGGADKGVWFEHESANIPTLNAVRQNISRLQGEVTQRQDQVKSLQEQRTQAIQQAEQLQQKSENETGDTSVETFREASALRKKAADLQTQIESIQAAIVPLERDLAVAQGQNQAATAAVDTYKAVVASMDQGWDNVQKQVKASQDLAAKLVGTPGETASEGAPTPATINAKAAELAAQLAENRQNFDTAEQHLNNAVKHFQDATAAATSYSSVPGLPPGVDRNSKIGKTADLAKSAMAPAGFKLNEAQARQMLATLHCSRALVLNTLLQMSDNLKQTIDTAGLEMPEALATEKVESDLDHSKTMANTGFQEAATLFTEASSAPLISTERKNVAQIGAAFAAYGQAQIARISDNADEAKQFLSEAVALRDTAIQNGAILPAMPPELVPPPPATKPATAPATAPTEGAAPPAEGAAPPAEGAAPPAEGAAPPAEGTEPVEATPPAEGAAPSPQPEASDPAATPPESEPQPNPAP